MSNNDRTKPRPRRRFIDTSWTGSLPFFLWHGLFDGTPICRCPRSKDFRKETDKHSRIEFLLILAAVLIIIGGLLAIGFKNGWGCPRGGCL